MALLVLWPLDDDDNIIGFPDAWTGFTTPTNGAAEVLATARIEHPDAFLAEPLTSSVAAKAALPGELARAVEAWNAMPKSVTVPRLRGNLTRLIAPYRKWKLQAGQRDYLLEQLVADVESCPYSWRWIRFPWLFGNKGGELNSEKLRSEAARGGWKDAQGAMTQADFVRLAARVGIWYATKGAMLVGDDQMFELGFEREIGLTWQKWLQIRKQFGDPDADVGATA